MGHEDRWSWRLPVVVVAVALASLAAAVAVVTGWTRVTLLDSAGYVDALVAPLAADPDVKDAVAAELSRELTAQMGDDVTARLQRWVPPGAVAVRAALSQWSQQIEKGWREQLRPTIRAQLDEPEFTSLWIEANRQAHRQFVDALADARTGAVVTINLRGLAQKAVRQTGVQLDAQFGLPSGAGTLVYAAVADALPPEAGIIRVDVSRVGQPARTAVKFVPPAFFLSLGLVGILALVAVGTAPRRRRGTAVVLLGLGFVLAAGGLWATFSEAGRTAGERASAAAAQPLSLDVRLVLDRQSALAVESFRGWAVGLAAGGLALAVAGGLWRLISGRAPAPVAGGGVGGPPPGAFGGAPPGAYGPPAGHGPPGSYGAGIPAAGGYPPPRSVPPAPGAYPPQPRPGPSGPPAAPPWS